VCRDGDVIKIRISHGEVSISSKPDSTVVTPVNEDMEMEVSEEGENQEPVPLEILEEVEEAEEAAGDERRRRLLASE
jgi:hypothetical protein